MKKLFYTLALVLGFAISSYAQDYDHAIGLRLGYPLSVSYKKYLNSNKALEIYGGFRGNTFYTSLYANAALQFHNPIEDVDNLTWYYGFGGGVAFASASGYGGASIGASGYLGLQYTLEDTPVSFSIDFVPTIYFGGFISGFGGFGALAARYVLN